MDNKIDWSLAPKWANKYGLVGFSKYPAWFDNEKYEYLHDGRIYRYSDECTYSPHEIEMICERSKQWSGPQDGLPPVGSTVEYGGEQVRVIAHVDNNGHPAAVSQRGENGNIIIALPKYYQPIRTPEQIARDLRESKIVEMMDVADVDCRVTAARLVDAGYVLEGK